MNAITMPIFCRLPLDSLRAGRSMWTVNLFDQVTEVTVVLHAAGTGSELDLLTASQPGMQGQLPGRYPTRRCTAAA